MKTLNGAKAFLLEKAGNKEAPHAMMAVGNKVAVAGEGIPLKLNLSSGDVKTFAKVADVPFVILPNVEKNRG